jgi:hypothetical protein
VLRALSTVVLSVLCSVLSIGCKPDFGNPPSLVTGARLLAIKGEPAEVHPGDSVALSALSVTPMGSDQQPSYDWALCLIPKPLDENNVVAGGCLADGGDGIMALQSGTSSTAIVPLNACALFGPDPPPQMPGMPPLRPRDPDVSGGYYQPVRTRLSGLQGFGLERVTCDLAQAGAAIAVEFAMQYKANNNPMIAAVTAAFSGQTVTAVPAGATVSVPHGAQVDWSVAWPMDSVESYPVYDIVQQQLITHRESLRVSWFATDGSFQHDTTGRDETEMETSTDNIWTAPSPAAMNETVHVWAVLRDSRGGVDWAAFDVQVMP